MRRLLVLAPLALALSALSGCGGGGPGANLSQQDNAKLDAYTQAYNTLIGSYGISSIANQYREQDAPAKGAKGDLVVLNDGRLQQGRDELRAAKEAPGSVSEEIAQAADGVDAALGTLIPVLRDMKSYIDGKGYIEDKFARGRTEHPKLLAEFAKAETAMARFDQLLKQQLNARSEAELARLKASGTPLEYQTKLAMRQAEKIMDQLAAAKQPSPQLYAAIDPQIAELERTIAAQRKAYNEAKSGSNGAQIQSNYEYIANSLTSMVGAYRDEKAGRQQLGPQTMDWHYNTAVSYANGMVRSS